MNFSDGLFEQGIAIGTIHTKKMITFIAQQFVNEHGHEFCFGINLTLRTKFTKRVNLTVLGRIWRMNTQFARGSPTRR